MSTKKARLDLVELTTRINCICGEWFYTNEFNDLQTCSKCKRVYEISVTFQEFDVAEVIEVIEGMDD